MTLQQFVDLTQLKNMSELEKVIHISFFFLESEGKTNFDSHEAAGWLDGLHFGKPNVARLRRNLQASTSVVRGSSALSFRLHKKCIDSLRAKFPNIIESNEVIHQGSIIPDSVFIPLHGYIESLCRQINASYENNVFDGCAVLMRRLMEILLIQSFEHLGIELEIRDQDGNYFMLEKILDRAKNNAKLSLSRNAKETTETFRKLGNFSAHKIQYTCRRDDIKKIAFDYRALFEELLYKAGHRK